MPRQVSFLHARLPGCGRSAAPAVAAAALTLAGLSFLFMSHAENRRQSPPQVSTVRETSCGSRYGTYWVLSEPEGSV